MLLTSVCICLCVPAVVTSCSFDGYFELSNSIYMEGRSPGASFAFSVEGRIDYCYNQTLHGVCDVGWTDEDAAVACRYSYGEGLCKSTTTSQDLCITGGRKAWCVILSSLQ